MSRDQKPGDFEKLHIKIFFFMCPTTAPNIFFSYNVRGRKFSSVILIWITLYIERFPKKRMLKSMKQQTVCIISAVLLKMELRATDCCMSQRAMCIAD
jgi:hypothetical protein